MFIGQPGATFEQVARADARDVQGDNQPPRHARKSEEQGVTTHPRTILHQHHLDLRLLAERGGETERGDAPWRLLRFVPFQKNMGVYNYVRTRLFSPSSPGESFFLAISGQLSGVSFSSGGASFAMQRRPRGVQ